MLQLLTKLFGKKFVQSIMGTRTNVQLLKTARNNPFIQSFNKQALKDNPGLLSDAETVMKNYAGNALANKNTKESAQFLKNLQTLDEVKNPLKAQVYEFATKKEMPKKVKEGIEKVRGGDPDTLQGSMQNMMALIDDMQGITPKMRVAKNRQELADFIRKMRGKKFSNAEIQMVKDYADKYSMNLAKEKLAPAISKTKQMGGSGKSQINLTEEHLDDLKTWDKDRYLEYNTVGQTNYKIREGMLDDLRAQGLGEDIVEAVDDELYQLSHDRTGGPFGGTTTDSHPANWVKRAGEEIEEITGLKFDTKFYENFGNEVLSKYKGKPEFASGGIARVGMAGGGALKFGALTIKNLDEAKSILGRYDPDLFIKQPKYKKIINHPNAEAKNSAQFYIDELKEIPNISEDTGRRLDSIYFDISEAKTADDITRVIDEIDSLSRDLAGPDYASGGMARVGFKNGKGVDLDRRMILKGIGALAALPVVGKFFKWAKPLAKRDIRVKMKSDMDYSWEGPESGWKGGTWLNLDFVPLTKKGKKILDDLAKNKKISKIGAHGDETLYGVSNSEDGLMAVEDIKKMKGNMELETSVHDKVKGSVKGEYDTTKVYSGKDIDSKKILRESSDLADFPYHDNVFQDEFTEEIINTIKKEKMASGGMARVGYANGSYKSEGLFGIPMEDIRKFKEKERMDRTSPLAIPDDWLERLLRKFRKTETYEQPMASGGIAGQLHLYDGGRAGFKKGGFDPSKESS